ncbi:phospholipase D-like domain-containing protein [Fluviicola sp.]|uniref:phospholipase D-like domain-containing protein n=1 Tax=Fluviicola sp. TaxID=1917219 RepID=UPI003D27B3C5
MDYTYELPSEDDFLRTLKEYIDHKNHPEIVEILKQCNMQFSTTSTFTNKAWDTYWCSIIFYIPVSSLSKISDDIPSTIKKYCSDILPQNCGYFIEQVNFAPQLNKNSTEEPELEVVFEQQKQKIIHELTQARFIIWVAVAWFTLDDIYELLVQKSEAGLDVRIVISKDEINKSASEKYSTKLNIKGYPKFGAYNDNFMHNKFCVIDLKKVIHGSYNWSKRAEYNKETIEIIDDRKTAERFSEEFKKLYIEAN